MLASASVYYPCHMLPEQSVVRQCSDRAKSSYNIIVLMVGDSKEVCTSKFHSKTLIKLYCKM